MSVLLQIDSSPMGEASISRRLTRAFVERWRRAHPGGTVIARDLAAMEIPAIDAAWITANLTPAHLRTSEQSAALALSTELVSELQMADEYVIGAPMHNWGPTARLKLWADQIVRMGETVAATPSGVKGILDGKRVTVLMVAGRRLGPESPDARNNHLAPWLRTFFSSLGITDVRFVIADGAACVRYGGMDPAAFVAPHIEAIESLFAGPAAA